ncbi:MAG: hypothetical protein QN229_03375 [Desulfurococcaceae archaeon TW002]
MRKLLVIGASGKLVRYVVFSLIRDYELFLQCNKRCIELAEFLRSAGFDVSSANIHLIRHDFIEEGVESLSRKLSVLTSVLDASILIEPVFNQVPLKELREELIKNVVYTNLVVPLTLIKVLSSFMISEPSVIIILTDLTPIRGSKIYEGLNPSLPVVASSAALHTIIKEAPHYLPSNIRVFGVALDWVSVPSKKLPPSAISRAMSVGEVANFIKELLSNPLRFPSGTLIELSRWRRNP